MDLWGGLLGVKRNAFFKVNRFSVNAITEDIDFAYKINKFGWKVQHSSYKVDSIVPSTLKSWFSQKLRWTSGRMQCLLKYPRVVIKNPIYLTFIGFYILFIFNSLYLLSSSGVFSGITKVFPSLLLITGSYFVTLKIMSALYGPAVLQSASIKFFFSFISIIYVIPLINRTSDVAKVLLIFPFSLIYFPLYLLVIYLGVAVGIYKLTVLKKGKRAW
jgi:cellulose synthase/poly-beta-1,6-N-acetylglucosamine synthase-like glycosyltransferase